MPMKKTPKISPWRIVPPIRSLNSVEAGNSFRHRSFLLCVGLRSIPGCNPTQSKKDRCRNEFPAILFTLCWIALNTWLLHDKGFDAYPYVLLNLVIGMIASLSAPVIMMSQNREAQKDRLRADLDYQVNLKNEMLLGEILRLLQKREKDAPKRYEDEE